MLTLQYSFQTHIVTSFTEDTHPTLWSRMQWMHIEFNSNKVQILIMVCVQTVSVILN